MTEQASSTSLHRKCFFGSKIERKFTNCKTGHYIFLKANKNDLQLRRHDINEVTQSCKESRGLMMWDGNFQAIPHIDTYDYASSSLPCTKSWKIWNYPLQCIETISVYHLTGLESLLGQANGQVRVNLL